MVKATYIYNFSKLIDWPETSKNGNFIISIMGGKNLYQEMVRKYNTKQIGSQQIEIRKLLPKTDNISRCHVLFVGSEYTHMLPQINATLKGKPVLIISDESGSLQAGSVINFIVEDHNLKYEVNLSNATTRNLFIGSTLKSLANSIQQ